MTFKNSFLKVTRFCCIAVLIVGTREVLADCQADIADGWRIDSICTSRFNSNGEYVESYCMLDPQGDPWGLYHMTCKPGIDPGTCIGSNCEQEPSCTWNGPCETHFDCCGTNVCNLDTGRCQEAGNGGNEW